MATGIVLRLFLGKQFGVLPLSRVAVYLGNADLLAGWGLIALSQSYSRDIIAISSARCNNGPGINLENHEKSS